VDLLIVTQGDWGERIADHLWRSAPSNWQVSAWRGPTALPVVIDEPGRFLPASLPRAKLLLALTESVGMSDLVPDIAQLCYAEAVIMPVDKRSWARPGLLNQVRSRLESAAVACAFPMPFCSLTRTKCQHPLIRVFASQYGRPELECTVHQGCIASCQILRETPCGNTRYIAERLVGTAVERAPEQAGLLHHYFPCWGGMGTDPVHGSHTLLHIAATMAQKSVKRAIKRSWALGDQSGDAVSVRRK
jgi:thymidylate synthase